MISSPGSYLLINIFYIISFIETGKGFKISYQNGLGIEEATITMTMISVCAGQLIGVAYIHYHLNKMPVYIYILSNM